MSNDQDGCEWVSVSSSVSSSTRVVPHQGPLNGCVSLLLLVTYVGLSLWFQTRIRWEINLKLGHSHSDQTSVLDVCYFKLFFISGDHLHGEVGNIDFRFGWRRGVVVSGVRQWTKLTHAGPGYNWDGWPSLGGYTISGCNQPTRSTQPCIPPGSLNRVPASAGVKAGMSPLPGSR